MQRNRKRSHGIASGLIAALNGLLQARFQLQFHGWKLRLIKNAPAAVKAAVPRSPPRRQGTLPPLAGRQVIAAHLDLRALLNRAPAARRVWPSLALLERVLGTGGFEGIHSVDACVLRHAAQSLDLVGEQHFSPGLVVLRRRIELVLRRKHLDEPTHWARTPCPVGAQRRIDPSDTMTDYIDLDWMLFSTADAAAARPFRRRQVAAPGYGGPKRL